MLPKVPVTIKVGNTGMDVFQVNASNKIYKCHHTLQFNIKQLGLNKTLIYIILEFIKKKCAFAVFQLKMAKSTTQQNPIYCSICSLVHMVIFIH